MRSGFLTIVFCLSVYVSAQEIPPVIGGSTTFNFDNIDAGPSASFPLLGTNPKFPGLDFSINMWSITRGRTCADPNLGFSFINPPSPPNILTGYSSTGNTTLTFTTPAKSVSMRLGYFSSGTFDKNGNFIPSSVMSYSVFDSNGVQLGSQLSVTPIQFFNCGVFGSDSDLSSLAFVTIGPFTNGGEIARIDFKGTGSTNLPSVGIDNLTINYGTSAAASVAVSSARVAQVVYSPQLPSSTSPSLFDLVQGKSSSFEVTLTGMNLPASNAESIIVNVSDGATVVSHSSPIPLAMIAASGSYTITPAQMSTYVPTRTGQVSLTLSIDTSSAPSVTNTAVNTLSLNVHQVAIPKIGFASILPPALCTPTNLGQTCYAGPSVQDIAKSLSSDTFVSATFPVPDHAYSYSLDSFVPSLRGAPVTKDLTGFWIDMMNLEIKRRAGGFNRMVGIADLSYFTSTFSDSRTGVTASPVGPSGAVGKSVMTSSGLPEVVAHELAHSFGQLRELYTVRSDDTAVYDNTPLLGFDGVGNTTYAWPPNLQTFTASAISFMGPSGFNGGLNAISPYNYWIDKDTYSKILSSLTSLPPTDPKTQLISGILTSGGQVTLGSSLVLPNGNVSASDPGGDISVALLDGTNKILSQTSIATNFQLLVTYSTGELAGPTSVDTGVTSFVVELPYDPTASFVQVSKGKVVIQTRNLAGQLLQGIVSAIPMNAFVKPEFCRKVRSTERNDRKICDNYILVAENKLAKIVSDIENKLNSKNPHMAIGQLEHLIEEIRQDTSRNYSVADASELSQADVIYQIREILENLKKSGLHDREGNHCRNGKDEKHNKH